MIWLLLSIFLVIALGSAAMLFHTQRRKDREHAAARRRYQLPESTQRIGVLDNNPDRPRGKTLRELLLDESDEAAGTVLRDPNASTLFAHESRMVQGVDGDMLLTRPPFVLRHSIVGVRLGRYLDRLSRRLQPWVVVCPRVRLDAIVAATNPLGRDPDDWRRWRKRARLRAIDILICDRRNWRPILAVVLKRQSKTLLDQLKLPTAGAGGSGGDRMIDEILNQVGLPVVYASGAFATDWRLIAPYVDESILRTRDPCVEGEPWDRSAAAGQAPPHPENQPQGLRGAHRGTDRIFPDVPSGQSGGVRTLLGMAQEEPEIGGPESTPRQPAQS